MENNEEKSYQLSIRMHSDGLTLLVYDEFNSLLSTKKVAIQITKATSEEINILLAQETQLNHKTINLIWESDIYAFIPTPFFVPANALDYLHMQQKIRKSDIAIYNKIQSWDTFNTFTIPRTLNSEITALFPNLTIEHQMSYLLTNKVNSDHKNAIYLWVRSKVVDLIAIKNGKLLLLNSFAFQTPEDLSYHTLNVAEQLELNTENCSAYLYNAQENDELRKVLSNYLTVITA